MSPIHSHAFKAWFGASVVVDAQGAPLVLFHGTEVVEDFTVFRAGVGGGSWFADCADTAGQFANWGGGRVMPVYLRITNPLIAQTTNRKGPSRLAMQAKKAGHDGLILTSENYPPGTRAYVVFNPVQIKSAIGNCGAFDPTNPSILA